MKYGVIGRSKEINLLDRLNNSSKSEFVAVYGRRRVGKTYVIRKTFEGRSTFNFTGIANADLPQQLENFNQTKKEQFPKVPHKDAETWLEAFAQLKLCINQSRKTKKVVFLDELPWLDTPRSGFISALEHFWNSWASARKDILLIVCGSAASWMLNKLINNRGGLHNRVTRKIKVQPFNLAECAQFSKNKQLGFSHYQLLEIYMAIGGIPFYWELLEKGLSSTQNIEKLCFTPSGELRTEFSNIFKSLFKNAERHEAIVATLATKAQGLNRAEISTMSKLSNGGGFTRLLSELEESGFIRKYTPFGKKMRNSLYQLTDFYSLFYFKFIANHNDQDQGYWEKIVGTPKQRSWSGYAFEQVCLAHAPQLKIALGISGIETKISSWRSTESKNGAQVDLVIDRRDQVINLCEMKFSINPFEINKKYDAELRNKIGIFRTETKTRKAVWLAMITTYGLNKNMYAPTAQHDLNMEILFVDDKK